MGAPDCALIEKVAAGSTGRPEAAIRLAYLSCAGVLTSGEQESFGAALWSVRDTSPQNLPADTRLLVPVFARLPAPAGIDREELVRARPFDTNIGKVLADSKVLGSREAADKMNRLAELTTAANSGLLPTHEQAARLFSEIIEWGEEKASGLASRNDPFQRQYHQRFQTLAGSALASLVVPSFALEDRTLTRANEILAFIKDRWTSSAFPTLPYFAHLPAVRPEIVRRIRRAIAGRHFEEVSGGSMAIERWTSLFLPESADVLPAQIIEQLVSSIETRQSVGLHVLIHCVCKLTELNRLRAGDATRLEEALGDLLVEASYERVDFDSKWAISISLLRAECVRLARALQDNGTGGTNAEAWLHLAESDPLPEVRYATA